MNFILKFILWSAEIVAYSNASKCVINHFFSLIAFQIQTFYVLGYSFLGKVKVFHFLLIHIFGASYEAVFSHLEPLPHIDFFNSNHL